MRQHKRFFSSKARSERLCSGGDPCPRHAAAARPLTTSCRAPLWRRWPRHSLPGRTRRCSVRMSAGFSKTAGDASRIAGMPGTQGLMFARNMTCALLRLICGGPAPREGSVPDPRAQTITIWFYGLPDPDSVVHVLLISAITGASLKGRPRRPAAKELGRRQCLKAARNAWQRRGLQEQTGVDPETGYCRVHIPPPEPSPLASMTVSMIVPGRDGHGVHQPCIGPVLARPLDANDERRTADNQGCQPET